MYPPILLAWIWLLLSITHALPINRSHNDSSRFTAAQFDDDPDILFKRGPAGGNDGGPKRTKPSSRNTKPYDARASMKLAPPGPPAPPNPAPPNPPPAPQMPQTATRAQLLHNPPAPMQSAPAQGQYANVPYNRASYPQTMADSGSQPQTIIWYEGNQLVDKPHRNSDRPQARRRSKKPNNPPNPQPQTTTSPNSQSTNPSTQASSSKSVTHPAGQPVDSQWRPPHDGTVNPADLELVPTTYDPDHFKFWHPSSRFP